MVFLYVEQWGCCRERKESMDTATLLCYTTMNLHNKPHYIPKLEMEPCFLDRGFCDLEQCQESCSRDWQHSLEILIF
jgi:hypothetical protein